MKITRRQLRRLIVEATGEDDASNIMRLLRADDAGSVKQGLDLVDMLGIDPYEYPSEKQFFETLSYFLDNERPQIEMVKADYYYRGGSLANIVSYLASKSLQESKALYDGISFAMDYGWMSDFKFKRHFDEMFFEGHRKIRSLQIERRDAEAYGMGDDYHEPVVDEEDEGEMSKEEHAERWLGEIEQQIKKTIEVLNYEVYTAMKAIKDYLDKEGQVSLDMNY